MSTLLWLLGTAIYWGASVYLIVLFARMVLDWILFFNPTWRPGGIALLLANLITILSDPPLKLLRRYVPPLRMGNSIAIDVGFMVLFIAMLLLQRLGITLWLLGT